MEVIRTAVSSLGHWDPDSGNTRLDSCRRKTQGQTLRIPLLIAAHQRLREGLEPILPVSGKSIAHIFSTRSREKNQNLSLRKPLMQR